MTDLRAGEMRTRAIFYRRSADVASRGQSTGSETVLGTRTVKLEWLSGAEAEQARQQFARASVRITMRMPRAFTLTTGDSLRISGGARMGIGSALPSSTTFDDLVLLCEVIA